MISLESYHNCHWSVISTLEFEFKMNGFCNYLHHRYDSPAPTVPIMPPRCIVPPPLYLGRWDYYGFFVTFSLVLGQSVKLEPRLHLAHAGNELSVIKG